MITEVENTMTPTGNRALVTEPSPILPWELGDLK
jgi:hypothetical protein